MPTWIDVVDWIDGVWTCPVAVRVAVVMVPELLIAALVAVPLKAGLAALRRPPTLKFPLVLVLASVVDPLTASELSVPDVAVRPPLIVRPPSARSNPETSTAPLNVPAPLATEAEVSAPLNVALAAVSVPDKAAFAALRFPLSVAVIVLRDVENISCHLSAPDPTS